MAVVTGRDVVVDPRVKGTITLQTDRAIAPAAAFNQFAAALRLQGFAVVRGRRPLQGGAGSRRQAAEQHRDHVDAARLQRAAATRSSPRSSGSTTSRPNNLLPVLRPLISPNNTINVNPGNNSLVITDYADNMRRLARIIAALDVPNASDIEVIPLKHSVATDMVPLVHAAARRRRHGARRAGAAPGPADASFRTTLLAEPRSNSLILRAANPARAQLVRTLIDKLDRAPIDTGNGAAGNIYVVYLKNADAVKLAATLRAAISAEARGGIRAPAPPAAPGRRRLQQASGAAGQPASRAAGASSRGDRAGQQRQPAVDRRPDPGRPVDQLADHHGAGAAVPAIRARDRQARRPPRAGHDRGADRRSHRRRRRREFGVQWQSALARQQRRRHRHQLQPGAAPTSWPWPPRLAAQAPAATLPRSTRPQHRRRHARSAASYVLGAIASFFDSDGDANVLSTPNLLTLDNEEAKIVDRPERARS